MQEKETKDPFLRLYKYLRFWNQTLICLGSMLERMGHSLISCWRRMELGLGQSWQSLSSASTCSGVYRTYLPLSIPSLLLSLQPELTAIIPARPLFIYIHQKQKNQNPIYQKKKKLKTHFTNNMLITVCGFAYEEKKNEEIKRRPGEPWGLVVIVLKLQRFHQCNSLFVLGKKRGFHNGNIWGGWMGKEVIREKRREEKGKPQRADRMRIKEIDHLHFVFTSFFAFVFFPSFCCTFCCCCLLFYFQLLCLFRTFQHFRARALLERVGRQ